MTDPQYTLAVGRLTCAPARLTSTPMYGLRGPDNSPQRIWEACEPQSLLSSCAAAYSGPPFGALFLD
eukprot:881528-Alexandrium_andersonii.AAC.1